MSKYSLGRKSQSNLVGVYPPLAAVVYRAIGYMSEYDFTVFEGIRTLKRQRRLVAKGVSRTMNSKHLSGRAVDLVPWINGKAVWDGNLVGGGFDKKQQRQADEAFEEISVCMKRAAKELDVDVENLYDVAGWDKPHNQVTNVRYDIRKLDHKLC